MNRFIFRNEKGQNVDVILRENIIKNRNDALKEASIAAIGVFIYFHDVLVDIDIYDEHNFNNTEVVFLRTQLDNECLQNI